jgi:hypothetical protein
MWELQRLKAGFQITPATALPRWFEGPVMLAKSPAG